MYLRTKRRNGATKGTKMTDQQKSLVIVRKDPKAIEDEMNLRADIEKRARELEAIAPDHVLVLVAYELLNKNNRRLIFLLFCKPDDTQADTEVSLLAALEDRLGIGRDECEEPILNEVEGFPPA